MWIFRFSSTSASLPAPHPIPVRTQDVPKPFLLLSTCHVLMPLLTAYPELTV